MTRDAMIEKLEQAVRWLDDGTAEPVRQRLALEEIWGVLAALTRPAPPDDLVRAVEAVLDHDDTHDTLHGTGLAEMLRAAIVAPAPVAAPKRAVPRACGLERGDVGLASVAAPAPETPAPVDVPACPDGQHSYRRNAPPQNGDVCFVCRKSIWWETPAPDAMPEIIKGDLVRIGLVIVWGEKRWEVREVDERTVRVRRAGMTDDCGEWGEWVSKYDVLDIERNGVVIWRRQEAQP